MEFVVRLQKVRCLRIGSGLLRFDSPFLLVVTTCGFIIKVLFHIVNLMSDSSFKNELAQMELRTR